MKYHVVTLGCAKNIADSEGIGTLLRAAGYEPGAPEEADVLIVNTCGFLQAARQESIETLNALGARKKPGQMLVAAGCLSERYGAALADEVPALDGIIGTQQWTRIAEFIQQLRERKEEARWRAYVMPPDARNHVADSVSRRAEGHSAYLKIADGCSAPCAFCTIPSFKGPQRSKRPGTVIREAQELVAQGVQEIVLVAQDLTAYGRDWGESDGLPTLLEHLMREVEGDVWFRLMYAYPGHASERLIEVMATHERICNYLDMPLQHGDPNVLKRMRRPHKMERIYRFFERIREAMPDISLRTTFIVGYPGETEAEFQNLLDFMSAIQFDKVGVFTFSPEPGTPAAEFPDQIPDEVKQERWERAMAHQQPIALARQEGLLGRTLDVLVDGYDADNNLTLARSYREAPEVDGYVLVRGRYEPGERLTVRITGAMPYDLEARVVKRKPRRTPPPKPVAISLDTIEVRES
nr:30S ribosomal protein S12 methylthiotransferase RimO [Ardenticatena sp.]